MPPWALDAKIELTGSQLLQLNESDQSHEEWGGFSDTDGNSDGDSDSDTSHNPSTQAATNCANGGPSGPGDAIPNPSAGAIPPSTTIEGLQASVNTWAVAHGFAVTRGHGKGPKPNVPVKDYNRYYFYCHRYGLGRPRPSRAAASTVIRMTPSYKCGCEWKALARKSKKDGLWHFSLAGNAVNREHNHCQAQDPRAPTPARKLQPEVAEAIEEALKIKGVRPHEVSAMVRQKFPGSVHTMKHIYNRKRRLRNSATIA